MISMLRSDHTIATSAEKIEGGAHDALRQREALPSAQMGRGGWRRR